MIVPGIGDPGDRLFGKPYRQHNQQEVGEVEEEANGYDEGEHGLITDTKTNGSSSSSTSSSSATKKRKSSS